MHKKTPPPLNLSAVSGILGGNVDPIPKIMISKNRFHSARATLSVLLAAVLFSPTVAFAGPPLICHPYEIGSAKSLPGGNWGHGLTQSYDRKALVRDTLELLTPDTPVVVRMETLRRAALYATGSFRSGGYTAEDKGLALALLNELRLRSEKPAAPADALAVFDWGFYAATLRQTNIDPQIDGYALLLRAATLLPDQPEVEFALALASSAEKTRLVAHLARARAGAAKSALLASNLESHFGKL